MNIFKTKGKKNFFLKSQLSRHEVISVILHHFFFEDYVLNMEESKQGWISNLKKFLIVKQKFLVK